MKYFLYISSIFEEIFYKLVYMSIIASVIGLIIFGITRIFKNKISPKWVSRIWLLFIIALIVPLQFKSHFSIYNLFSEDIGSQFTSIHHAQTSYHTTSSHDFSNDFQYNIAQKLENNKIQENDVESIKENFENDMAKMEKDISISNPKNLLPVVWLIISQTLVILYIVVYINFILNLNKHSRKDERLNEILKSCKQEMNIKRKITILYQNIINMPSIFGIFKIKILINNDAESLSDKELSYIIKHELAHYKRKDNILNLLITIFRCIYFFNPVVFFLLKKVKKDLELATDELAMKKTNKEEQKDYLKTLVVLSERKADKFLIQTLCLSDEKKNLERRIDSLKLFESFKKNSKKISILSIGFLLLLIVTCFSKSSDYIYSSEMKKIVENQKNINPDNYYIKIASDYDEQEIYVKGNNIKTISKYKDNSYGEETSNSDLIKSTSYSTNKGIDEIDFWETRGGEKTYINISNSSETNYLNYISQRLIFNLEGNSRNYFYKGIEKINGKDCYVVTFKDYDYYRFNDSRIEKVKQEDTFWIEVDTGLILKEDFFGFNNELYYYEFGNVKDEDFEGLDRSEYIYNLAFNSKIIDFYEIKEKILKNNSNTQEALDAFKMLENLPEDTWHFNIIYPYLLKDKFVFSFDFINYDTSEFYEITITVEDNKIVKLDKGKVDEDNNKLVESIIEY